MAHRAQRARCFRVTCVCVYVCVSVAPSNVTHHAERARVVLRIFYACRSAIQEHILYDVRNI